MPVVQPIAHSIVRADIFRVDGACQIASQKAFTGLALTKMAAFLSGLTSTDNIVLSAFAFWHAEQGLWAAIDV